MEAEFCSKFGRLIRKFFLDSDSGHEGAAAFEMKVCVRGKALAFSRLEDHQSAALKAVKGKGLYHKIPDGGLGQKPFDGFYLAGCAAFVVVGFYDLGRHRNWIAYLIDVDEFEKEAASCGRKSITEERARELGIMIWL